jgi:hypothetical protein
LREADRILTDLTNELLEASKPMKDPHLFDLEETKQPEKTQTIEEEKKEEAANKAFMDIFEVNEQDLLDLFEGQDNKEDSRDHGLFEAVEDDGKEPLAAGASSDEEENEHLKELLVDFALDQ